MTGNTDIQAVLSTVRYDEEHLHRLRDIFQEARFIHLDPNDEAGIAAALQEVDVAVLASDLDERFLHAPKLRWIHCDHAGLNKSSRPEIFERGLLVTGSAGRSAPALAEHVLFFALALTYHYPQVYEAQNDKRWGVPEYGQRGALYGKTIGILGLGNTGKELAIRAQSFQMNVLGYRRSDGSRPEGVDQLYCQERGETPDELLRVSDIVAIVLPLTDETHHLIGERELKMMKKSAMLINLGRGAIIDEDALIRALYDGDIAGAGLDTFTTEPLPQDSPLWHAPNTLITPHATPPVPDKVERSLHIIRENAKRYRAGEPLLNQLKPQDVYTKG